MQNYASISIAEAEEELAKREQEADLELSRREAARTSSIEFAEYVDPAYIRNPFYDKLNDILDEIISGEQDRVMIFAPPQHGKSRTISEIFPARWFGVHPDLPVAIASYSSGLAEDKSIAVRDIIEGEEYRCLYGDLSDNENPISTRADKRAVNYWHLNYPHKGRLWAGGVGGPITGRGFHLIIVDDPFENWETAQSQTIRNKVYSWYKNTLMTRLREGGRVIIVMTRWHEDDLAGRLMSEDEGQWSIYRFPAMAETQEDRDKNNKYLGLPIGEDDPLGREAGEPLSPELFSKPALERKKAQDVSPQGWAAEYDGVPRPADGDRFKRHWFERVAKVPLMGRRVRYWDKAGSKNKGAYTCGTLMLEADGKWYIEDVIRGQWSAGEREDIIKATTKADAAKYGITGVIAYIEQEPGSGGLESADSTIITNAGYMMKKDLPRGDKDTRMEPFANQAEHKNILLLEASWTNAWLEEITAIPNSKYRDQGDAASGAFNKLTIRDAGPTMVKMKGKLPGVRKR